MFNLFNKRKGSIENDVKLLSTIVALLPEKFKHLHSQLINGLIKGRFKQEKPFNSYIGFTYNSGKPKLYEDRTKTSYILKGIKVFNRKEDKFTEFEIYIANELIAGYATQKSNSFEPDLSKILVKDLRVEYMTDLDSQDISKLLSKDELAYFDSSAIYKIELSGKNYFHVLELEDGDFIAIDEHKKIYKVTHDPFKIDLLSDDLLSAYFKYKSPK